MSRFLINGATITREVAPRTHLADFLREDLLLTATHLGCEQGVCGACTVLIDGAPARACLTPAVLCAEQEIWTLEGLEHDPVIVALRDAFSAEHALQCGYCTPGMLVTARDIVLRLPDADEGLIRLELAGNLCRCTGYLGIVRAIQRVLALRITLVRPARAPIQARSFTAPGSNAAPVPMADAGSGSPVPAAPDAGARRVLQDVRIGLPADQVWQALLDPALLASCVPGATLTRIEGETIEGAVNAALGPIRACFTGAARLRFDRATRTGTIEGDGQDKASGTRLSGAASFGIVPVGTETASLTLSFTYGLRGPLAQFGRGPIVEAFAAELVAATARTLEARLRGDPATASTSPIGARLILVSLWSMLRRLVRVRRR